MLYHLHYFAIFLQETRKSFSRKKMVGPWYGWFIDYCLLNVKTQLFHAYSWRKQVQQYNNNYTDVEEWENQSKDFWLPLDMYRDQHRSEHMLSSVAATMRLLCCVFYYRGLWRTRSVANILLATIYGQISRIITWQSPIPSDIQLHYTACFLKLLFVLPAYCFHYSLLQ